MSQTVRELARMDTGLGTVGGGKADFIWEGACDRLDMTVVEFIESECAGVSDSYVRKVLKELPPESFGL